MLMSSADFFPECTFSKNSRNTISECQTVLIQVRAVCKVYQQKTKVPASMERVNLDFVLS